MDKCIIFLVFGLGCFLPQSMEIRKVVPSFAIGLAWWLDHLPCKNWLAFGKYHLMCLQNGMRFYSNCALLGQRTDNLVKRHSFLFPPLILLQFIYSRYLAGGSEGPTALVVHMVPEAVLADNVYKSWMARWLHFCEACCTYTLTVPSSCCVGLRD